MADTNFTPHVTVIASTWLQDVNDFIYKGGIVGAGLFYNVKGTTFGAAGDGTTDDTTAIQLALTTAGNAGGGVVFFPKGDYLIGSPLIVPSNVTMLGVGLGSRIKTNTTNISLVQASSKTGVQIKQLGFLQTAAGASSAVAHVDLSNSTRCIVVDCDFQGCQWAGVWVRNGSTKNVVKNNFFHDFLGTVQDSSDILVYQASNYNVIDGNICYGGNEHGILVQDPNAGLIPSYNVIANNRVGQHTGYGIAIYMPGTAGSGNSFNQIIGNQIENIQGSFSTNRSSGAGIYVVGAFLGGTQVIGNNIQNCCVHTTDRALAPGGVGISGVTAGVVPPLIKGNTVSGMTQGDGIIVVSSPGGALVVDNVIQIPSTNNGGGDGGSTLTGSGIRVEASSLVYVGPNHVTVAGTGNGYFGYANGIANNDNQIVGGYYTTGSAVTIRIDQNGGFTHTNLQICGVRGKQTGNTNYCFSLASINGGTLTGGEGTSGTFEALRINACTQFRVGGGAKFTNTNNPGVSLVGTCTGTLVDESVYWGTSPTTMSNTSTGGNVNWYAAAAPITGNWIVGDWTKQNTPVVGNPKGWRCTVAGGPGTWVSEGNL